MSTRAWQVGEECVPPERTGIMVESTALYMARNYVGVRNALARDGYVLLRGVLPREDVLRAREVVIDTLHKQWQCIDDSSGRVTDAFVKNEAKGVLLTGYTAVTHHSDVLSLLEGEPLVNLMTNILGAAPATYKNKWVRVMGPAENTDQHTDFFRFRENAERMHTVWVPLGDYTVNDGTLAVCQASHKLGGYNIEYGVDSKTELPRGFDSFSRCAQWRSATFHPGDLVVFDIKTVHASTSNNSTPSRFRISMDTRWQPASLVRNPSRDQFVYFGG